MTADLADIQGDILQAYGNDYACTSYVFLEIVDATKTRKWLRPLVDRVTSATRWPEGTKPDTHVNVAFTPSGLTAIGVPDPVLATFSSEFRQGMLSRAAVLGDVGAHAPDHWEPGLGSGAAHLLLILNAKTHDQLTAFQHELLPDSGSSHGLRVVHDEHAELLDTMREHFGYADGLAQPAITDVAEHRTRGGGTPEKNNAWKPLALGEFILGYDDEASLPYPKQPPPDAPADPLGRHGTYLVWRKLHQDVALFRRTLRDAAAPEHGRTEALLAAKIVGRWQSGASLILSPYTEEDGFTVDRLPDNDFRYGSDPDGLRCPLGAHVRRSNPRDALGYEGVLTFRHRMVRRGMPYGAPLPPDVLDDDGQDRGLIFVCYVASISRQFEGVQTQWMEDGNIFGLGHDKDFLQRGTGTMTVQGNPPFLVGPQSDFVTMRGGAYLFVPSITALGVLADGLGG